MSTLLGRLAVGCAAGIAVGLLPAGALAQEREPLDVEVFARVGSPGQPEGIVVDTDGTVYVGTHNYGKGDAEAPSKIFAFDDTGRLLRDYVITGQNLDEDHGILAMAFDVDGELYVLDRNPARMFVLDPATGAQRDYATFADVPSCNDGDDGGCSATVVDLAPFPDYPVFAPDGTLYVTDLEQGLIWRVPPGGGEAEVWFTDPRLEGVFGPNGIQFLADGTTLLFAQTGSQPPGTADPVTGKLYRLPVRGDGRPGELEVFWEGRPVDGPDGFAIGRSGRVYVALAGANQLLVLGSDGAEEARVPATPAENRAQEVPFDTPASVAFLGRRLLITNQSFFTGTEDNWAVFDVFAGEQGLPLLRPRVPAGPEGSGGVRGGEAADRGSPESAAVTDAVLPATGGGATIPATVALGVGLLAGAVLRGARAGTRVRSDGSRPEVADG